MRLRKSLLFTLIVAIFSFASINAQDLPTLLEPEDDANCVSTSVIFDWTDVPQDDLSYYTIEISKFSDFSVMVDENTGMGSSTYSSNMLQHEETYYWRIITNYTNNTSQTTDAFRFTTKEAPPELVSPANEEDCLNRAIQFEWNEVENAQLYHLQISTAPTFGQDDILLDLEDLDQTTYTDNFFENGMSYFWRVKAYADCETDFSNPRGFTIKDAPPAAVYPEDDQECVEKTVTLEWEANENADHYSLQLSKSINFPDDDLIVNEIELTQNTYQKNLPDYYETYYWRVKTFIDDCETNWSEPYKFKTAQEVPMLQSPTDQSTGLPLNTTLSWDINGQPNSYNLMLGLDENFINVILDEQGIADKFFELSLDEQYFNNNLYWKVQAVYDDCNTEWSEVYHLRTQYKDPALTSPEHESICISLNPQLQWDAINGANSYRVQIALQNDFDPASIIVDEVPISNTFYEPELTNGMTTHFWRVRGEDEYNTGKWSEDNWFQTAYNTPSLINPPDEATGQEREVVFQWEEVHENLHYELQVSVDPEFQDDTPMVVDEENLTGTGYTAIMPDYYETYYWRVRARDTQGCRSAWSDVYSFRTMIPAPELIYPENNAVNLPLSVVFQWEKIADAQSYGILLSTDQDFADENIVFGQVGILTNSIIAKNLEEFTEYYWKVNASNADGSSDWSEIYKFTTGGQGPDKVVLEFPIKGAKKIPLDVTCRWKEAELAECYTLQVAENENFFNPVVDETGILELSYDLSEAPLENYTVYYWRVQAVNANGVSEWSDVWNFRTVALPPQTAPDLLKPQKQGMDVGTDLLFEWSEVEDATSYHIQLASAETFAPDALIIDQNRIYDTKRFIQGLDWETNYYWRVRGENEAGAGPWSEIWSFETMVSVQENIVKYSVEVLPNPITQTATIQFVLPEAANTSIEIYDLNGRIVDSISTGYLSSGFHNFTWNADALESGTYLVQISVGKDKAIKQVILSK